MKKCLYFVFIVATFFYGTGGQATVLPHPDGPGIERPIHPRDVNLNEYHLRHPEGATAQETVTADCYNETVSNPYVGKIEASTPISTPTLSHQCNTQYKKACKNSCKAVLVN